MTKEYTGIKKAVKEAKDWSKRDRNFVSVIMADTEDNTVWCDVFIDCNHWKEYHSNTIINVSSLLYEHNLSLNTTNIKKVLSNI